MMGKRGQRIGCVLVMLVAWSATATVLADEGSPSYVDGALRKLGRGVANIASCPLELIRTPALVGRRDGQLSAMTVGVVQGAWRTLLRGGTGLFEVATFYAEIPRAFQPLLKPEFVWAHGNWVE